MEKENLFKVPNNLNLNEYISFWEKIIFENIDGGIYIESNYQPMLISKSFKDNNFARISKFWINETKNGTFLEPISHEDFSSDDIEKMVKKYFVRFDTPKKGICFRLSS